MTWSYALTRRTVRGEVEYAVREIYYDTHGNVVGWSDDPDAAVGETIEDTVASMHRILAAAQSGRVFDIDTRTWSDQ